MININFMEAEQADGTKVAIRLDSILYFCERSDGGTMLSIPGEKLYTAVPYEELKKTFSHAYIHVRTLEQEDEN